MKLKRIAFAVALLGAGNTFIVPAAIAELGYYAGGSIGQSKYKDIPQGLRNVDDKDTGYKLYGGYQVNRNWGLEATYYDLGRFTGTDSVFNGSSIVPANASAEVTAWGLSGVFSAPINYGLSVFGKLGLARSEVKTNSSGLNFRAHQKESSTGATFGLGAKYDFSPSLAVRAEWERLQKVGDNVTTGETDMNFLSTGITIKF